MEDISQMTYTPEQIHSMSDPELCEAISTAKNPIPEDFDARNVILHGLCWNIDYGKVSPVNWLSWENAGRLLEELQSENRDKYVELSWFPGRKKFTCWVIECLEEASPSDVSVESDRPTRAICEAYLLWYQEHRQSQL